MATPLRSRGEGGEAACAVHGTCEVAHGCRAPLLEARLAQAQARISQLEDTITLLEASLSMRMCATANADGPARLSHSADDEPCNARSPSPSAASHDTYSTVSSPASPRSSSDIHDAAPQCPVVLAPGADTVSVGSALSVVSSPASHRSRSSHVAPSSPRRHAAADADPRTATNPCSWAAAARDMVRESRRAAGRDADAGPVPSHLMPAPMRAYGGASMPVPTYYATFAVQHASTRADADPDAPVSRSRQAASVSSRTCSRATTKRHRRRRSVPAKGKSKGKPARQAASKSKGKGGGKKGKLEAWERKLTDEFVALVQGGEVRVARGDLAKALRSHVNTERNQEFYEKLVSRRKLNVVLAACLAPRRGKRSRALQHLDAFAAPSSSRQHVVYGDFGCGFEPSTEHCEYRPAKTARHTYDGLPVAATLSAPVPWTVA